jgi:hypothetical protein
MSQFFKAVLNDKVILDVPFVTKYVTMFVIFDKKAMIYITFIDAYKAMLYV